MQEKTPLILTAKMDDETFSYFNSLRQKYFPPARNFLDAHITLFHQLPYENLNEIEKIINQIVADQAEIKIEFPKLIKLGSGTAAYIESEELKKLQVKLSAIWESDLIPQDKQGFRPHVTIQNKVSKEIALRTFEILNNDWKPRIGKINGLNLWKYVRPKWEFVKTLEYKLKKL